MKRSSLSILAIFALLASLGLSACEGVPPTATLPQSASELTLVDALGRTVQFPTTPRRIAIAGKGALTVADAAFMFPAARERVVALVRARQNVGDFLSFVDSTFDQKTLLEVEAGPEQIAAARPDVVILKSYMADKLGQPLEQIGIPVVYVDLETPEQYFRDLTTLGQLFGDEMRAKEINSFYQSRMEHVTQSLPESRQEEKPRLLLLQHTDKGGQVAFNVPAATWLQTTMAELAGGLAVWKEAAQGGGWTVVNFEQIAAWNPDQIFIIDYASDATQVVESLKTNPQWQTLKAVQRERIYGFAGDIFSWDQPDPRWILGLTWLARQVHPEHLPDVDMMQEVYAFFGQMYGLEDAAIQEHILPNLKGDVR